VRRHRSGSRPDRPVDEANRRQILAAVSLLIGYPDGAVSRQLPVLARVANGLPAPSREALTRFLAYLETTPAGEAAANYVDTFDLRRRCCLYLTYYAFGDTRKRGTALLRFAHAYRAAGLEPPRTELPDHLGVVCHFAAIVPDRGLELLVEHRAGVDLLRQALHESGSPYVDVVDALGTVLPEPTGADLARALDLARRGPPAEEVGLEPFAPPEYMGTRR
jgi:nitrate reductase delta subunit